jgi:DNA-binding transcriptional ArsR family regulator
MTSVPLFVPRASCHHILLLDGMLKRLTRPCDSRSMITDDCLISRDLDIHCAPGYTYRYARTLLYWRHHGSRSRRTGRTGVRRVGPCESAAYHRDADPSRQSVNEISRQAGLPQPLVSHHLRILRERGLARADRRGEPPPIDWLTRWSGRSFK